MMGVRKNWRVLAIVVVVLGAVCVPSFGAAQTAAAKNAAQPTLAPGTIAGQVADQTGGVMPGVSVTLRNSSANFERTEVTDGRGRYAFDKVPAGTYTLTAFIEGFQPNTVDLTFAARDSRAVDLSLSAAGFKEEVTVAFTAPAALTATKIDAPLRDIPLSVKSFTGSFMKAIEAERVSDMYTYMTGVSRAGDTAYDFTIRGVRSGEPGNIQVNGLPGLAARFGSPSTINVDRIEVLKGPASVLYGQVQPGGLVNIVTKKPQARRSQMVDVRYSTFAGTGVSFGDANIGRFAADFTGPMTSNQHAMYRVMTSYDSAQSFRGAAAEKNFYFAPSFSFVSRAGTSLTVELEYRHENVGLDSGLVAPNNDIAKVAPRTTLYQEPGDRIEETGKVVSAYLVTRLGRGFTWNTTWRSVFHNDSRKGFETASLLKDNVTVRRRDRYQVNHRSYQFGDSNLKREVFTGSVRHTLLAGVNGGYELRDFDRLSYTPTSTLDVNLYNPVYGKLAPAPIPGTHLVTDYWNLGAYAQDQVEISKKFKALAGLRYDSQNAQTEDLRSTAGKTTKKVGAVLPMAGIVYQPERHVSLYSSYSTSFTPPNPSAVDAKGLNTFDPEKGRQVEVGSKFEALNGNLDATLAWFNIVRDNVINAVGGGISVQTGQERSRGVEFELRAKPVPEWQVIFGYAHLDALVMKDTSAVNVGARSLNVPGDSVNLWTRYDLPGGQLRGLGFGFGIAYQSTKVGTLPAASPLILTLPAYTRVDLGVYYVAKKYELTLKVANVSDKLYYESAAGNLGISVGKPRQMTLSMRVRF
jgi:iron complex outermembrane receptor protein